MAGGATTTTPGDDDQGTAGVGGADGDGGSIEPPGEGEQQTTGTSQPTAEELDFASANGIAVNLASGDDFQGFETGINPLTDMGVRLLSSVETISFDILSALFLGIVIAFFFVRRIKDDEEDLKSQ